ncbi:MAG: hypothetical protein U5J63_10855 [Fodinibius sp.]|nr:hypothetical protein [Fodinibius sp.]
MCLPTARVTMTIYNINGQKVREPTQPGNHVVPVAYDTNRWTYRTWPVVSIFTVLFESDKSEDGEATIAHAFVE